ncbi:MAG TPA: acetyl-CoA carboxylase, carboxyltransferase subunit beta [candidate division Zixibacteria bacterium]|nr:acetyl-CoA carboxylase, carboxyltransferase subunit beta [candidate division Zixibacteria bacterium]
MRIKFPLRRREGPPDAWTKCPSCDTQVFNRQLERNLRVCPTCGHHFRMGIGERIDLLLDRGSFVERDAGLDSTDPLAFHDQKPYLDRLEASRVKTGLREAAVWGTGRIEGVPVVIGLFDFRFMGGSMGSVVGEKIARCFEAALTERVPAIVVSASGGARMQEGTLSLLQLAKTTAPLARMDVAGVPFISVLTDPTTGGVLASFASLGDVIVAEPRALIGFAGARVASGTVGEELPDGFQTAEFLLEHGFVDMVVPRAALRSTLARLLKMLPVPAVDERLAEGGPRGWGPISVLSGLAEKVGGAVSETIGLDLDEVPGGNGVPGRERPASRARAPQADGGDER